jgi:hypothetical protein
MTTPLHQTFERATEGLVIDYVVLPRSGVPAARTLRGGVVSAWRDVLKEKLESFVLQDI